MTNLDPLWRRMAGEQLNKLRDEMGWYPQDERYEKALTVLEAKLAERLAGVLGAAQYLIEDYRPVAGGGDPRMDVLKAELERLLKG